MSTNSYIGVQCEDGVRSIYCHWDGYPEHVGKILNEHYKDFLKVCTLINTGDLSSLGAEIGTKHEFDTRPENECTFYGRDRGDQDTEYNHFDSEDEFVTEARDAVPYAYLFTNGAWITYKL